MTEQTPAGRDQADVDARIARGDFDAMSAVLPPPPTPAADPGDLPPPPPAEPASPETEDDGELLELLAALATTVEGLSERVDAVERRPRMVWPTPSRELDQWVNGWLVPTFRLETVLEGWPGEPAIVSELAALYSGYCEMTGPKATGWDALSWHQYRASTVERIISFKHRHHSPGTTSWGS